MFWQVIFLFSFHEQGTVYFKPTCLGTASTRSFELKNTCRIPLRYASHDPSCLYFFLSFNFQSWEKCVACRCSVGEGPFHYHLVKTDSPLKIIIIVVTSFTAWTGFCGRFQARKLKLWVFTPRRESYYLMKLRWGCYNSWSEVIFNYILQAFWEFLQYP